MHRNKTGLDFIRKEILSGLDLLPDKHKDFFKRIYANKDSKKSLEDVVATIPDDRVDWALSQVQRTLIKVLENQPTSEGGE